MSPISCAALLSCIINNYNQLQKQWQGSSQPAWSLSIEWPDRSLWLISQPVAFQTWLPTDPHGWLPRSLHEPNLLCARCKNSLHLKGASGKAQ